jgi:aminoglycoside phosphotransferase (APT) family kinase protein
VGDLESALLDVIAARSGRSDLKYAERPRPIGGGYWAEIFGFALADAPRGFRGDLILRLMPDAEIARRETALQTAVAELGFPTPRVRAAGGAESFGRAFAVMDRARGTTFDELPTLAAKLARALRFPRLLADAQSRLHALPAASVAARLARRGVAPAELALDGCLGELAALVRATGSRELADAFDWLAATRPPSGELVLTHGDIHPNNLIVDGDGAWTLIDWTNARFADPELDVAFTSELLELRPLRTPRGTGALTDAALGEITRRMRAAYAGPVPLDRARLAWYRALYQLRIAARTAAAELSLPNAALSASHPNREMAPRALARLRRARRRR